MSGLFDPIKIGRLELKNRVVMAPMLVGWATEDGEITQRLIDYYIARAKGGVGFIIVECAGIDPRGRATRRDLLANDDRYIPGLSRLAKAVQAHGAKIALQLGHAGSNAYPRYCNYQPLVPSILGPPKSKVTPRELSTTEVKALVEAFAQGAKRAKEAGFDAVEILAGHGELLNQFISPYYNLRNDEYGGSFENRTRFLLESIARAKEMIGDDFPFSVRFSADEFLEGGMTLEDTKPLAQALEKAGIQILNVSATTWNIQKSGPYEGWLVHLAEGIKQVVGVPVITVGRISTPEFADHIIRENRADLVALGRALLRDADWALKAAKRLGVEVA